MGGRARSTNPVGVWIALVVVTLIVSLLAAAAIRSHANPGANLSPSMLGAPLRVSTLAVAGMNCPTGAAFSPDGSRVAVIGVLGDCDALTGAPLTSAPHALAILAARTGALLKLVRLEPLLGISSEVPTGPAPGAAAGAPTARFFSLGWSPDGARLALVYTAFVSPRHLTADHVLNSGLLILDARSGNPTIIPGDSGYFPTLGGVAGFPVWNLASQIEIPASAIASGLTYTWARGSAPSPLPPISGAITHLPIDAGPRYPIGNPDGGPTFTIWQPGVVIGPRHTALGAGRVVFLTVFPTWSPDSAQVTLLAAGAILPTAATATSAPDGTLPLPTPSAIAQAPARDAALDAIQRQIGTDGWALVAWNPNGSLLASVNCHAGAGDEALDVRDTSHGAVASSAPLGLRAGDAGCGALLDGGDDGAYPRAPLALRWSPRGDSILVCDSAAGILSIWPVSVAASSENPSAI